MATDSIRYDLLVQEALRDVVRRVLTDTMRDGLAGEHHFYVTFQTSADGVRLSDRMRERYPGEMTIILQHQFWDLVVTDVAFEVGLSFSGVPERLLIPFKALTGFFDPSVEFGLKFEGLDQSEETASPVPAPSLTPVAMPKLVPAREQSKDVGRSLPRSAGTEPAEVKPERAPRQKGPPKTPAVVSADAVRGKTKDAAEANPDSAGKVIAIDAFRKKP